MPINEHLIVTARVETSRGILLPGDALPADLPHDEIERIAAAGAIAKDGAYDPTKTSGAADVRRTAPKPLHEQTVTDTITVRHAAALA